MAASRTTRWKQQPIAVAVASAFLLSSCSSLLPPSLRKLDEPMYAPEVAAPAAPASEKMSANDTAFMEPKTFPGTGIFVNPKPPAPPLPPGPEEASLNFESLDIREVSKVILGDYLKQSYTVHPAVVGTVTFRTVKPIPMKDLLPTDRKSVV